MDQALSLIEQRLMVLRAALTDASNRWDELESEMEALELSASQMMSEIESLSLAYHKLGECNASQNQEIK